MNSSREPVVFFDVDTQVDFMLPAGRLYVPGAEKIVPQLRRLMDWARLNEIPVISSADAHTPDDPEFKIWPPHCVVGTPGQRRIPETQLADPVVLPCQPGAFQPPARSMGQYIVEKPTYSAHDNPNLEGLLRALQVRRAVVFGVATEFCVRADALALLRAGYKVDLVTDAIKPITEEGGRQAMEEMLAAGAHTVTAEEICSAPVASAR